MSELDDRDMVAERLDRHLRARLIDYLQNRVGDHSELAKEMVSARAWAAREFEAYRDRWDVLLEVLEDSRLVPAKADQVDLLTDRESSILAALVIRSEESSELRPRDLAEKLGMSDRSVDNYLRRMEKAGLVVRHRVPGKRAVLVFPTRKAVELADQLALE